MTQNLLHDRLIDRHPDVAMTNSAARPPGGSLARWLGAARVQAVRDALSEGGVNLTGSYTGELPAGSLTAQVTLETDDLLGVRSDVVADGDALALLERCAGLPGNVRFAAVDNGLQLAAETRIDGVAHLPRSLREISAGFSFALGQPIDKSTDADELPPGEAVRAAVEQAKWSSDDAVETEQGWELRPRLEGTGVAVRVILGTTSLIVQRPVLVSLPGGISGRAALRHALACNVRVRFCRLAVSEGHLVAECGLRPGLVDGEWLTFTTRAVAAAARSVEPELRLLATEPTVAAAYAEMFLTGPDPD
jgi:hypothetical protein